MSKPKFTGYPSSKPKYYRELWNNGPIMVEARRLARLEARAIIRSKGHDPYSEYSERAIERLVDVLIFNSEDVYLKRAKWNLKID